MRPKMSSMDEKDKDLAAADVDAIPEQILLHAEAMCAQLDTLPTEERLERELADIDGTLLGCDLRDAELARRAKEGAEPDVRGASFTQRCFGLRRSRHD